MWYVAFVRFIRRRLVLAIIFILSLTYCIAKLQAKNGSSDEIEKRERPIIWRTLQEYNTSTNDLSKTCRNSVQGKVLIVDDQGFVCSRFDLLWTGCCNIETENTKLYNCETCKENRCCAIYENCVSCCLNPDKKSILEKVMAQASGRQVAVYASINDHFELCLAKCRTNSDSVKNENKYRDHLKHCYGETKPHSSQVEVINSVL